MALSKFEYNSFHVTPVASNAFAFNSTPNGLTTASAGAMNLITTNTISSGVSSSDFTSSIDSTYDTYLFKFINIHPASNAVEFKVNFRDGGSNFDATKTTTNFMAYHQESGSSTSLEYRGGDDLAQSTGDQTLGDNLGDDADASLSGYMYLFNPSSTTFVKHFIAQTTFMEQDSTPYSMNSFTGGYCNVTAAIDGVTFKMNSGNIDSGVIKMYGITK